MPSLSQKTRIRRERKLTKAGRKRKKARTKEGTPKFPIHQAKQAKSA